ncbi:pyridoxamine 5'-phosphate oxidase family protein, partial [Vibrio harveyi]
MLSRTNRT